MNPKDIVTIDKILRSSQLSHRDCHEVERLGNDAFDYIRDLLLKSPGARTAINGLKLLIPGRRHRTHLDHDCRRYSRWHRHSLRTPISMCEPLRPVWWSALWHFGGALEGPDSVGVAVRVLSVMRSSLSAEPKEVERKLLEGAIAEFEAHSQC
jgi:hypothetical protein